MRKAQKRAIAEAKRAAFLEQERQRGLRVQEADRAWRKKKSEELKGVSKEINQRAVEVVAAASKKPGPVKKRGGVRPTLVILDENFEVDKSGVQADTRAADADVKKLNAAMTPTRPMRIEMDTQEALRFVTGMSPREV